MKSLISTSTLSLLILFGAAFTSQPVDDRSIQWQVDKSHTTVQFGINHFFTEVVGIFDDYNADIRFDPENPKGSSIEVVIPISAVNTQNEKRDNHLMSEDFFNAKKWPNMTFKSEIIRRVEKNEYIATGELTIRDVTRTIDLPFTLLGTMDHPMMKGTKIAGITAKTTINRTDYGVGVGDWAATMVVGDEVDITLNLELNRK